MDKIKLSRTAFSSDSDKRTANTAFKALSVELGVLCNKHFPCVCRMPDDLEVKDIQEKATSGFPLMVRVWMRNEGGRK